jgi:amino acid transporter
VALISEVAVLLLFDLLVFGHGGGNIDASALNPVEAFTGLSAGKGSLGAFAAGAAGIGVFYAFWSWVGFEMAPNYGEESKDPKRIVPRAMYISVIGLGVFYTITSWAAISGYDSLDQAASSAYNNPLNFFFIPAIRFGNETLRDVMSYLIITGSFACGMAFHNTTARYFYSLGREKVLPTPLGRTHEKHKSPYIASTTQSVIAALIIIAFAVRATVNPDQGASYSVAYLQVYGLMAFMGVVSILAIQALVSVAIWNYFRTHHPSEHHIWNHTLAPLISVVGQVVVLYLAIKNIDFLGSGYSYAKWLVVIDALIFVAGIGAALYLKSANRAKYETIGRLINEGM